MDNPITLVLFGITGDLAERFLLPAFWKIQQQNLLPAELQIIGVSRRQVEVQEVLVQSLGSKLQTAAGQALEKKIDMFQLDPTKPDDYERLKAHIETLEQGASQPQRLFYVSVPPQISLPIIDNLGKAQLVKPSTKLLLEKPFGTDLVAAQELIDRLKKYFKEEQIYRIDHYLAKEMTQNILVFRNHNPLFQNVWNNRFIEDITISVTEKIGIEGRAVFYEQTGALRDMLQSHLMQLLALTLADLPDQLGDKAVQAARLAVLTSLQACDPNEAVRGQYKGYTEEVNNPKSKTETFAAVTLYSTLPEWKGVPLHLITGKALDQKATEIRLRFKADASGLANTLTLRIQPKEGVELEVWAKQPGYERKVEQMTMAFSYNAEAEQLPEAYEQVLLDALRSDKTLFATSEEIIEAWRVLTPVQQACEWDRMPLIHYSKGSKPEAILAQKSTRGDR